MPVPVPAPSPAGHPRIASAQIAEEPASDVPTSADSTVNDRVLREVRRLLGTLRFGSVTLIVQDGRIVQVETTSKVRFTAARNDVGRGG